MLKLTVPWPNAGVESRLTDNISIVTPASNVRDFNPAEVGSQEQALRDTSDTETVFIGT